MVYCAADISGDLFNTQWYQWDGVTWSCPWADRDRLVIVVLCSSRLSHTDIGHWSACVCQWAGWSGFIIVFVVTVVYYGDLVCLCLPMSRLVRVYHCVCGCCGLLRWPGLLVFVCQWPGWSGFIIVFVVTVVYYGDLVCLCLPMTRLVRVYHRVCGYCGLLRWPGLLVFANEQVGQGLSLWLWLLWFITVTYLWCSSLPCSYHCFGSFLVHGDKKWTPGLK